MLTFSTRSPSAVAQQLAERMRAHRLLQGWSREELSARSGVTLASLQKFEQTGQISLDRLLLVAASLGLLAEFGQLLTHATAPRTLAELEDVSVARRRQRGRTLRPRAEAGRSVG
jgi:transcriptional regulator with XRE-family HTH domain